MIVGRKNELQRLDELYYSDHAELVAVYGRRRVGKTFLISNHFKNRIVFTHSGLSPIELKEAEGNTPLRKQLKHFYNSLIVQGMKRSRCPDNWLDAFLMLELFLISKADGHRQIVFLDELPWMDTQKSGFVTALEGFWNTWACHQDHLMVVVCGSSTSWMLDKLVNNHGGLYNRLTCEICLRPFTLRECEEYFKSVKIRLSRYDIVQAYMVTGGIPYYLSYFRKGLSIGQNIDQLFFDPDAPLQNEYDRLFASVFTNPEEMKTIIQTLSSKNCGYTRSEIARLTGSTSGGALTDELNALIAGDFIRRYQPFGMRRNEMYYKLIDPFCLFYLKFVAERSSLQDFFWESNSMSHSVVSWRGFAFENVCFNHIRQIKAALGISGVSTEQSAWSKRADDEEGTQIDMIILRKDNIVNMCEIKYSASIFTVNKQYDLILRNRQAILETIIPRNAVVHNTLITTHGLKYNEYSGVFDQVVTLDALFQ